MAETYQKLRTYREPVHDHDAVVTEEGNAAVIADTNPAITKAQMVVQYVMGIILSLLAVRFLLALFGANQANGFVDFIYGVTSPLVAPFQGLFNITATSGAARFEFETLVAAFIYMLLGIGIVRFMDIFRR